MKNGIHVDKVEQRFPDYIRKPMMIKHLCSGRYDRFGRPHNYDIGIAEMRNREILPISWGCNYTLEDCKRIRSKVKNLDFVYVGCVWDSTDHKDRPNFERVLQY